MFFGLWEKLYDICSVYFGPPSGQITLSVCRKRKNSQDMEKSCNASQGNRLSCILHMKLFGCLLTILRRQNSSGRTVIPALSNKLPFSELRPCYKLQKVFSEVFNLRSFYLVASTLHHCHCHENGLVIWCLPWYQF